MPADTKVFLDGVENMGRSYSGIGVWDLIYLDIYGVFPFIWSDSSFSQCIVYDHFLGLKSCKSPFRGLVARMLKSVTPGVAPIFKRRYTRRAAMLRYSKSPIIGRHVLQYPRSSFSQGCLP